MIDMYLLNSSLYRNQIRENFQEEVEIFKRIEAKLSTNDTNFNDMDSKTIELVRECDILSLVYLEIPR